VSGGLVALLRHDEIVDAMLVTEIGLQPTRCPQWGLFMLFRLFAVCDHVVPHAWEVGGEEDVAEQTSKAIVHLKI
jgi:hypothetical protein